MTDEATPDLYINSARFAVGVYDVLVDFGLQDPPSDPNHPPGFNQLVRIRMSPQHALVLSKALADLVFKYEQQIGKLNVPPQIFLQMGIEP